MLSYMVAKNRSQRDETGIAVRDKQVGYARQEYRKHILTSGV